MGAAYFLATVCELLGHGEVISIAPRQHENRPLHPRLRYLTAAPHQPEARQQVTAIVGERSRTPS